MSEKKIAVINIILCMSMVIGAWVAGIFLRDKVIPNEVITADGGTEADGPAGDCGDWAYYLINEENTLPADYMPELKVVTGIFELDIRCADYAVEMLAAMESEGLKPCVVSAYRSPDKQSENLYGYIERLMRDENYTEDEAYVIAASQIAQPGASEHNAGLALDILIDGWYLTYGEPTAEFEDTAEFAWLEHNAHKYGFILRYPKDKEFITGFTYEPWHFRFVGLHKAEIIYNSGLTLEEHISD